MEKPFTRFGISRISNKIRMFFTIKVKLHLQKIITHPLLFNVKILEQHICNLFKSRFYIFYILHSEQFLQVFYLFHNIYFDCKVNENLCDLQFYTSQIPKQFIFYCGLYSC